MDGVQIVIAPNMTADDKPVLIIGFHAEWFSQTVTLPYQGEVDTRKLGLTIAESLNEAAKQIEGHLNAIQGEEVGESVANS